MRINLTSVFVDDQRAALSFYTDVLGFTKYRDIPVGNASWLTVVSPDQPDGPELLLEPSGHPAVKPYRDALVEDGIPLAQFAVDNVEAEHARLIGEGGCSPNRRLTSAQPSWPSSTIRAATSSSWSRRNRTQSLAALAKPRARRTNLLEIYQFDTGLGAKRPAIAPRAVDANATSTAPSLSQLEPLIAELSEDEDHTGHDDQ